MPFHKKKEQKEELQLQRQKTWLEKLLARFRPGQILALSFLIVILTGALLLSMPFSNQAGGKTFLDHLFTAVSAVCVTGLSTVTVAEQYTLFGKTVMIFLMEIGGLGLMMFVALVMMLNRQKMSMQEKRMFATASGKAGYDDVPHYIKRIFTYTAVFEGIGFLLLSIRFTKDFGMAKGLFYALFTAVSAFTNAGFDPFASDSLLRYARDPLVSLTVMGLITVGGLGFMVWFELYDFLARKRKGERYLRFAHLSVHARIVLKSSLYLFLSGTLFFLILEWNNPGTIGNEAFGYKLLISAFQSVTLRTAGFATVAMGKCTKAAILTMCFFMIIGGSPGGTAGGLKTTTAVIVASGILHTLKDDQEQPHLMHRSISRQLLFKAASLVFLYLGFLLLGLVLLLITDGSHAETSALIFEECSAIATVGLTAGITGTLSVPGRIILMVLMYTGRIGPFVIISIFGRSEEGKRSHLKYPPCDIMIG